MRLFIALYFDEPTQEKLIALQKDLSKNHKGRYTKESQLHITLHFFADIDKRDVDKLTALIQAMRMDKTTLNLAEFGHFTRPKGNILYLSPTDQWLYTLESKLRSDLKAAGFKVSKKTFKPHITLARDVLITSAALKRIKTQFNPIQAKLRSVALMHSKLTPQGAKHTTVYKKDYA